MNQLSFSSPVVVSIETAPGRTRQYPIRDLYRAMAVMRYCQVGEGSGVWQGLGHEHNVPPLPRLPLSG
jgi:hypothetical protein